MSNPVHATTLAAALGCGLVGGLCFAFSTAVMPAFDDLAPSAAIAAMQSINRSIVNPVFLLALLGTALAFAVGHAFVTGAWRESVRSEHFRATLPQPTAFHDENGAKSPLYGYFVPLTT